MEVMYRYHQLLLWTLIILVFVTIAKTQTDSLLFCNEIVYVEYGKRAIIPCTCEPGFDVISWFKDGDYTNLQPPFIYLDAAGKHGTGYDSNEFDLDQNGTLTIRNVSLSHDECFAVKAIKSSAKLSVVRRVHVTVVWGPHDPVYPVVNGLIHQQHVYMDVNRNGALTCSLYNVHPVVNLTWGVIDPSHLGKIDIHDVGMRNTPNVDGTFNVLLDSQYVVADLTIRRIAIECKVTDEMSEYFAETTKVELLFPTGFPIVNGHVNQQHVYLDTQRKGKLNCAKKNVRPSAHLGWEVVDPASEGKIKFQSETNRSQNMDGTVDIFLTSDFTVDDDRLERITLHCRVFGGTENDFNATTVDLLFPDAPPVPPAPPVPVINGCYNQQETCILRRQRKGELVCGVLKSQQQVELRWKCDKDGVIFRDDRMVIKNNSGVFDMSILTQYEIKDEALESVTIHCDVVGWRGEAPPVARVALILDKGAGPLFEPETICLLVIMAILSLNCVFTIMNNVHMKRTRRSLKTLESLPGNSNQSKKGTCKSTKDVNLVESVAVQESQPARNDLETAALMEETEIGDTGSSDVDSGKSSGSGNGVNSEDNVLVCEGGTVIVMEERSIEGIRPEMRQAKEQRLIEIIRKTFQLLFDKYLSSEHEIEETVALLSEEGKKEKQLTGLNLEA